MAKPAKKAPAKKPAAKAKAPEPEFAPVREPKRVRMARGEAQCFVKADEVAHFEAAGWAKA